MIFVKKITLKNYKKFEDINLSFDHHFTLLIGKNGSGKTAILEGIADGLVPLVYKWSNEYKPEIKQNKVRRKVIKNASKANIELQYPSEVYAIINTKSNRQITLPFIKKDRNGGKKPLSSPAFRSYSSTLESAVSVGEEIDLPLIVFYKTNRLWANQQETEETNLIKIGSKFDTYNTCLNPTANSNQLVEWFKRLTYISIQDKKIPPELVAVQEAIKIALGGFHDNKEEVDIFFDVKSDELLVQLDKDNLLPMNLLSDGYRNTLGMIGDIAYRMAEINPHLTTKSHGIVLIDEIDLHLHPEWQKTIVGDLKKIFPNCQFIATTHSPFIIQSLSKEDELIKLEENMYEEISAHFTEQSVEDIAEQIQEVENPQWSEKRQQMYEAARVYFSKMQALNGNTSEEQVKQLREELELIKKPFADNVAYIAFLEQKQLLKEAEVK